MERHPTQVLDVVHFNMDITAITKGKLIEGSHRSLHVGKRPSTDTMADLIIIDVPRTSH